MRMHKLNYPLKFKPIYHPKIWGGNALNALLHKDSPHEKTGESWEISAVKGNISVVSNGALAGRNLKELCQEFPAELMGPSVARRFDNEFPLLIKFIDAAVPLSVQVHPDDELAAEFSSFGKSEMWVILNSGPKGKIYLGFKENESPESIAKAVNEGNLLDKIQTYHPNKFDAFHVKAGTIHTIGEDILLAEIQQTSDLTFRLFDFDRTDENGEKRELHIKESLRALQYQPSENVYFPNTPEDREIVQNQYFKVNKLHLKKPYSARSQDFDSFVIYMILEGSAEIVSEGNSVTVSQGETALIPYEMGEYHIDTSGVKLLEIFV